MRSIPLASSQTNLGKALLLGLKEGDPNPAPVLTRARALLNAAFDARAKICGADAKQTRYTSSLLSVCYDLQESYKMDKEALFERLAQLAEEAAAAAEAEAARLEREMKSRGGSSSSRFTSTPSTAGGGGLVAKPGTGTLSPLRAPSALASGPGPVTGVEMGEGDREGKDGAASAAAPPAQDLLALPVTAAALPQAEAEAAAERIRGEAEDRHLVAMARLGSELRDAMAAVAGGVPGSSGSRAPSSPQPPCQECARRQSAIDRLTAEIREAKAHRQQDRIC
jgi:hypothetical protein